MKICFSATGKDKDSLLDTRFGRCPFFLVYDEEKKEWQMKENEGITAFRGAGVVAAQTVVDLGCQVVISGNMGPNAFRVLSAAGVKIYQGNSQKKVVENLKDYQAGKLNLFTAPPAGRQW